MVHLEWNIMITSQDHLNRWISILQDYTIDQEEAHREERDHIYFNRIIRFQNQLFLSFINNGEKKHTTEYVQERCKQEDVIYHPFNKPEEWDTCNDLVWTPSHDFNQDVNHLTNFFNRLPILK